MTDPTKVMLSDFEAMLVNNSDWILTKHRVMEKVSILLAAQVPVIDAGFLQQLTSVHAELVSCRPKISKGERYRELPYAILDYPAVFFKTDVFALRTMFWWGNFISVTLHLSGRYKTQWEQVVWESVQKERSSFYISTGNAEWEHHFEEDNYVKAEGMNPEELHKKIVQPSFIKIALQYDLHHWSDMNELLQTAYSRLAGLLKS